jgi:hypothetical protein
MFSLILLKYLAFKYPFGVFLALAFLNQIENISDYAWLASEAMQ